MELLCVYGIMSVKAMPTSLLDPTNFVAIEATLKRVLQFKIQRCKVSFQHIRWTIKLHKYNINYKISHFCNNIKCLNSQCQGLNYKCATCKSKSGIMSTQIVTRNKVYQILVEWILYLERLSLACRVRIPFIHRDRRNWCCYQLCINHNEMKHCHFTKI
jgi:hypothetical protein